MSISGVSYTTANSTTVAEDNLSSSSSLSQVDFMTLLTTQMEYQDPTNPVDNTEMINQMTAYSSLDEQTQTNESLNTIIDQLSSLSAVSSSSYLGQDVMAAGGVVEVEDGVASDVTLNLDEDAALLSINIYNSGGSIVDTREFSNVSASESLYGQAELNPSGKLSTDGDYYLVATAYDENGSSIDVSLSSIGTVKSINQENSGTLLILDDGREVSIADVTLVS
ncbi:flagellar basal-body rod modification protein FlgD [Maridesulfovibrio ferrireducens]|uniref:Basal-body rod modification protein FlgD n=1 Tax=Maridesulfovibrio ferrireducens TaxID=246191 RepID=A0A1G9JJ14_9BACT|nr:flagellar hook capping FlgD N-terminal domain-containing protein [Maridesulfovibrio ferrireducens]SDL37255.1 flagellar basal-body rod modification protein FlgD [Maridesulfovibrio ferrireducens]